MKLIILNFSTWSNSARGGRLRRIYKRIWYKGKWTPFVTVEFKLLPIHNVSNFDFLCKETILINGKGKCKNQCNDCSRIENTEYTDTNGHIGSCC